MSDIVEIEAHRNRAQAAYDKLPLSGPVGEWCEMYGEDLLDSCTKLLDALKQRTDLIDAAAKHWLESCRVANPPIPWEGAIDGAMESACKEIERLRAERSQYDCRFAGRYWEASGSHCPLGSPCARCREDRLRARVAELEAESDRYKWQREEMSEQNDATERWAAFGRAVMKNHKDGDCGDVDGEWLQGTGLQTGVLQIVEAKEPCAEEDCMCAATCGDWPVDCYRVVAP